MEKSLKKLKKKVPKDNANRPKGKKPKPDGYKKTNKNKNNTASKNGGKTNQHNHNNDKQKTNSSNFQQPSKLNDFLRSSALLVASAAATKASSLLGDDTDTSSGGRAGEFDLYFFAQSWAPRFCCTSLEKCEKENMKGLDDLSTHGLWPAYWDANKDGRTYPAFCPTSGFGGVGSIPGVPKHMSGTGREQHEWEKHGTCTNLTRVGYFQEESGILKREAMRSAMAFTRSRAGDSISIDEMAETFGGLPNIAFKSDKFCRLEEITTCWEKQRDGRVGNQIPCPSHVLASARNNAITEHKCSKLWLDAPNECKFVNRQLLNTLKSE